MEVKEVMKECYRCGKVGPWWDSCGLCGSWSVFNLERVPAGAARSTAYSLASADRLDYVTRDILLAVGLSVRVVVDGTATSYGYLPSSGVVTVCTFDKVRGHLTASGVETAGDVVRLALADWHTWGGRLDVLPNPVGPYRVELVKVVR